MGNTTIQGGGARPTSHFSSTSISYRPSNASGLSNGGFGGNGGGSGDSINLMDFIVTPDEMDIYEASEVTGSLGIEGAELPKPDNRPWYEKLWDGVKSTGATVAVGFTSVVSGVLDVADSIVDGGAYVAAGVCDLFGADETASNLRQYIVDSEFGDSFNEVLYGENGLIKGVNDASYMKYDGELAQGIRKVSSEVTEFALATAATVCTGGALSVAAPLALGFLNGAGEKAESVYREKGTDIGAADNAGILIAGVGEAASWYAKGKLGSGITTLIKTSSEYGLKATGGAIIQGAKNTLLNIKDNGVLNTLKGIVSKEQILANLKTSLLQGDNISDSIGIIGDNLSRWINGDEEFNLKNCTYAFGELIATWGLNVLVDSATDYIGALNSISGIDISSVDDIIHEVPEGGDYVDETALFGGGNGSNEKKGFLSRIFGGSDAPTSNLNTNERLLRDRINAQLRNGGSVQVNVNNTTEVTSNVLRNVDDLSRVQVRINGGFNDLNGNFRVKYNDPRYISRITYQGYEALAITERLDELAAQIDMSLPEAARAKQIYDIVTSQVPPRHDWESYPKQMYVFQSLRGLTDVNEMGSAGLVCAGYAQTYKELCTRAGIKCDYIRGMAYGDVLRSGKPGGHAWNVVVLSDGTNIPVDTTWGTNGNNWFGGSDAFVARHIADADEWFKDYSAPKTAFDQISSALSSHDNKYGTGSGLERLRRYLTEGDPHLITSNGGARDIITRMSRDQLQAYVDQQTIDQVFNIMSQKYNSPSQANARLRAFITPGNENYGNLNVFTSTGGARDMMRGISPSSIQDYLNGGK